MSKAEAAAASTEAQEETSIFKLFKHAGIRAHGRPDHYQVGGRNLVIFFTTNTPECEAFSKKFKDHVDIIRYQRKKLDFLLISLDKTAEDYKATWKHCRVRALQFEDTKTRDKVVKYFNVTTTPIVYKMYKDKTPHKELKQADLLYWAMPRIQELVKKNMQGGNHIQAAKIEDIDKSASAVKHIKKPASK